jgi:CRISPR-associated endoribonuclease Cas6
VSPIDEEPTADTLLARYLFPGDGFPMQHISATRTEPRFALPSIPLGRFLSEFNSALQVERRTLLLEVRSPGRLVPWIGPAIRGITALRYRASVCQQPKETWSDRWKHCRGCLHLSSCGYGIAFEPESTAVATAAVSGLTDDPHLASPAATIDAVRRVVIAPEFPTPVQARRGNSLRVRITSIGSDASATVPGIVAALAAAGQRDGLGPDRVRFSLVDSHPTVDTITVDPAQLPPLVATAPLLPRLTICLDGPLFLREREARSRRMILDPDFATFVRHSLRIVREFFPALSIDSGDLHEDLARSVATVASDLRPFHQDKASRRTFRRFALEGVVGSCSFADVPGCFLPWLALAGILHVGGHRVAGAGGWVVLTDPAAKTTPQDKPR